MTQSSDSHARKLKSDVAALEFRLAILDAATTFEDIEAKYNHNHDRLGRFAFNAGGGSFRGGGASGSWGTARSPAAGRRNIPGQVTPLNNTAVLANVERSVFIRADGFISAQPCQHQFRRGVAMLLPLASLFRQLFKTTLRRLRPAISRQPVKP